jgi:hypothetical protein
LICLKPRLPVYPPTRRQSADFAISCSLADRTPTPGMNRLETAI